VTRGREDEWLRSPAGVDQCEKEANSLAMFMIIKVVIDIPDKAAEKASY